MSILFRIDSTSFRVGSAMPSSSYTKRNYRGLDSEIPDTYQSILNLIKQHGGSQLQHLASATICTKNTKKMLGWNRFYEIYLKFVLRQHQDVRTEEAVFVVKVKLNSECLNRTV